MAFAIKNIDSPVYLMHFLATNIPFEPQYKQDMLEERDLQKRAYLLYTHLRREAQLWELKADIQSRTREDLSQQQREHFLQQQIKTIQEELGTADEDLDALDERAKSKTWNEAVEKHYQGEQMTTIDGVKIDFADGWVHLRKSNTEPIIRIYSEAHTMQEAERLAEEVKKIAIR